MIRVQNPTGVKEIAAIREGNEAAFEKVYEAFHAKLFHYFLKRNMLHDAAKELTQLSFIKLWQSRHTLSDAYSFDTQFFNMASSVLIDHYRKQAADRKGMQFEDIDTAGNVMVNADGSFESKDYLHVAAEHLPPVRKNIFMLKTLHGYTNKEVAEELSISVKTVEDHYSKALRHIRSAASFSQLLLFLQC